MDPKATAPHDIIGATTATKNNSNIGGAGNIRRYVKNWKLITSNCFILRIVEEGYKIQFRNNTNFPPSVISDPKSSEKILALQQQISRLLNTNAISITPSSPNQILSRVFTVKKSNNEDRLILDLSQINLLINKVSFKMETIDFIKDLIDPSDYLVSLDLSDAFFSVCIHNDSKDYLCFQFQDKTYHFNVLPFGMTSSPRIFSKLLRVPILHLRNLGYKISFYLDDIFLCSHSPSLLKSQLQKTLELLTSLGFTPNFSKSNLIPSRRIKHLGFIWDTESMMLSVPEEKILKANYIAKSLTPSCSLRSLSSFIGLANSLNPGFPLAPLHFRNLQFLLASHVRTNHPWDSFIKLDLPSLDDINWWTSCFSVPTGSHIKPQKPNLTMSTDASTTGWGAVLSTGESVSGSWSDDDSVHINILELKAVKLSIDHFLHTLSNKHFTLYCDNFTAVTFLNKRGGTHSKQLCSLALNIWELLSSNNITCEAIHIAGSNNCEADFHSRIVSFSNEYSLSCEAFHNLLFIIPFTPTVDLFASNSNFRLPNYVSWNYDPKALKTNAFSFQWPDNVYMFPPINLISKCLDKIKTDGVHQALLITPAWPGLISLPIIFSMLIDSPIFISNSNLEGPLPTRRPFHMMAWSISSLRAHQEAYLKKLLPSSSTASQSPLSRHTVEPGESFIVSLKKAGHTVKLL